ncbi:MAG TPA: FAD-dependent monooxygenase [Thermomicrobiales bacterium]|nr:FAD-dependent monooxygenase [Thermomicrobiales bacterium]
MVETQTSNSAVDRTTPVLIVGGGLAGLSTALFLSWHGVQPLLIERHPELLIHPRARGFSQRTVELFRQVGLEPVIRAAGFAGGDDFRWVAVRAETLASEHVPVEEADEGEEMRTLSPAPFAPIDQDKLEVILRGKAEELGADIRFSAELVSFDQDDTGLTAILKDRRTGSESTVRADYLVAADGWDSPVRERLGIGLDGPGPFFHVVTALVDADVRPALRGRRVNIAYLQQPRPGTILMAHDEAGQRWVFGTGFSPQYGESLADFPEERVIDLIREAAGLPDVAVSLRPQIPGTDLKMLGFAIGAQVARQYRDGRVFLVGDAAHIVPPTGGLGANTGIQDAHNLAWKLAAAVKENAEPALLDTYHDERRPVGLLTMEQALARWGSRVGEGAGEETVPLMDYAAVAFGYRYQSAAVIGAPADARSALPIPELTGQPGTRAPHIWLERDGQRLSTIDLFGRGYVLLTGPDGGAWVDATRSVTDTGVKAYRIGGDGDFADSEGRWAEAYGVTDSGAVLVRPDGFVAWRSSEIMEDPARALSAALLTVGGHREAAGRPA